ncbi:MAG: response regulator [Hyphomicrobium sp.]
MRATTTAPAPKSDLLSIAGDIDLSSVATPPAGLQVENLRRRGIDVMRVKWGGAAKKKGWLGIFGLKRSAKDAESPVVLTFIDRQIRYQNATLKGPDGREIQHSMNDLSAVSILDANGDKPRRLKIDFASASLTLGDGLPDSELNWLRDRIVLEAAGLTWKPLFNVGKRTTRTTSNPDEQLYLRWSSSRGRLVNLYLCQAVPKCAELKAALASNDKAGARAAAHWLKSSSAAVGAMQLSELCQRLEIDLDAKDLNRANALAPHIFGEFEKVSAAFQSDEASDATAPAATDAAASADMATETSDRLSGVSALLVDDSRVNQEVAGDCLMRAGASVTFANNGQEAIDKNTSDAFDVILMDCQMSGVDGFATTRAIREHEMRIGRHSTPIIALTASALRDDRNICLAAGMNDYLSKPFVEAELIDAVWRWTLGRTDRSEDLSVEESSEAAAFREALNDGESEPSEANVAA